MALYNIALEQGGGIAADKTGVKDFVTGFDKGAFPNLPFGTANIPNPFLETEKTLDKGVSISGKRIEERPVLLHVLKLDDLELPNVIVEVAGRKNIVSTKIAGKDDVVNEIMSFDSWALRIRGHVINESETADAEYGYYPYQKLKEQVRLFRKNQALKVESEFLLLFDIHYVILTDVNFPDMSGYANVFAYEFSAISDKPVQLVIKK
ncbi:DUF6046 domain-containing protein [Cytophagaceae bacterium DM2B3-1]|uniref:DUF6046 domain-containing protein n=1 Tax=Xanthocytophaga flava TaxID=3048013 RepID=A0ABT7CN88_9BACT|nr:DUF6046 domain-containing protein [Xanthocytophaga flavus]MDJ1494154.1 DUF6046 domain-containing protein [Xanthocytophaga flavus]